MIQTTRYLKWRKKKQCLDLRECEECFLAQTAGDHQREVGEEELVAHQHLHKQGHSVHVGRKIFVFYPPRKKQCCVSGSVFRSFVDPDPHIQM